MPRLTIEEPKKDITQILEEKAEIARDRYKPLVDIREILLEAKQEIESLRVSVQELRAETARLNQIANY